MPESWAVEQTQYQLTVPLLLARSCTQFPMFNVAETICSYITPASDIMRTPGLPSWIQTLKDRLQVCSVRHMPCGTMDQLKLGLLE
jgi:hypothetical protein